MNPTVPIPQVHPTKGLTGRRSEKMAWATTLLKDPNTLLAYEEYARESAYEVDVSQPSPSTKHRQAQPIATPPMGNRGHAKDSETPIESSTYTIGSR